MDKKTIQSALTTFTERMQKKYRADRVILFGSYARGEATEYSDVDVLVVSSFFQRIPQSNRLDVLYDDIRDLTPDFNVFGLTPSEYKNLSPLVSISEAKTDGIQLL